MSFFDLMKIGRERRARRQNRPTPTQMLQVRLQKLEKFGVKNSFEHNIVAKTKKRITNSQQSRKIQNRNIMLGQIERFYEGGNNLKPLEPEQRYIVSPHDNISNLYANTLGMSKFGMEKGLSAIRPVFKDEKQRSAFHRKILIESAALQGRGSDDTHRINSLKQLREWSSKDNAMFDFSSVNTKRSHPIVYTQGHGKPGSDSISSDKHPITKAKERVKAEAVGQMLHDMQLPSLSEVRANSCYSGTQYKITSDHDGVYQYMKQGILEFHKAAGNWSKTFAGKLEAKLHSLGRRNRVSGYMGPTSQNAARVKNHVFLGSIRKDGAGVFKKKTKPFDGSFQWVRGMRASIKTGYKYKTNDPFLRKTLRRRSVYKY